MLAGSQVVLIILNNVVLIPSDIRQWWQDERRKINFINVSRYTLYVICDLSCNFTAIAILLRSKSSVCSPVRRRKWKKNFVLIYQRHSIRVVDSSVLLLLKIYLCFLCVRWHLWGSRELLLLTNQYCGKTRWFLRCVIRLMWIDNWNIKQSSI